MMKEKTQRKDKSDKDEGGDTEERQEERQRIKNLSEEAFIFADVVLLYEQLLLLFFLWVSQGKCYETCVSKHVR